MTIPVETIWVEYHAKLLNFIRRRVEDEPAAEDILQEVFVKIQSHINSLRGENRLAAWLYRITRNAIIDHYRANRQSDVLPENLAAEEPELTERAEREIEGCLEPMIRALPDKYRQAIILSEIEELPQKQVADQLGLSWSGAKSRIQRGRAMLKDTLLDCCRFEYDALGNIVGCEAHDDSCGSC
jgi:RNA polymerase sigma-70 factor (ECF subfamily)